MSWGPLRPARAVAVAVEGAGTDADAAAADIGHRPGSAQTLTQARQVFLAGNQLPARWSGRDRFVVLDTAFGGGHKFLATWSAWQQDPHRCGRLHYLAIAPQPCQRDDLVRWHASSPLAQLAGALAAQWPPLTPDLHVIELAEGRVRLLLALGTLAEVLPEWLASIDAFYLDGPAADPEHAAWDRQRLRRLPRLAAPGATLAAGLAAPALATGLAAAGFEVQAGSGATEDGPDTVALTVARFAPRFTPPAPTGRQRPADVQTVAVIGAGLAGSAVARALADQGLAVQVFDRRDGPARETSGNPGGLFHGIVHGHDGPHARWLRSAALRAGQVLRALVRQGLVEGAVDGLLRGEQALDLQAMQALLDRLGLPPDYLQARRAAAQGGSPAWFYPGGGWVSPAGLCAHWLAAAGITARFGTAVHGLSRRAGRWQLLAADGQPLATADAVVLCNAADAGRLLASVPSAPDAAGVPETTGAPGAVGATAVRHAIDGHLHAVRGQITLLPAATPGLPDLPLPVADTGYALRLADGRLLCGASAQTGDAADDGNGLSDADHARNLATLRRLTGWSGDAGPAPLAGRVGWRQQSDDRLPLLGPVPQAWVERAAVQAGQRRHDQPRHVPRVPGLFVFTALGSRGITHAALGGEALAAWIAGAPMPVPASLLDALDPARFIARAVARPPRLRA